MQLHFWISNRKLVISHSVRFMSHSNVVQSIPGSAAAGGVVTMETFLGDDMMRDDSPSHWQNHFIRRRPACSIEVGGPCTMAALSNDIKVHLSPMSFSEQCVKLFHKNLPDIKKRTYDPLKQEWNVIQDLRRQWLWWNFKDCFKFLAKNFCPAMLQMLIGWICIMSKCPWWVTRVNR